MPLSKFCFRFVVAASMIVVSFWTGFAPASRALGQEPEPAPPTLPKVPTIPETEVEAKPPTDPAPGSGSVSDASEFPENYDPNANQPPFDPVVNGSRFTSPQVQGYRADSSTAGSLIDIPDRDLPGTVNVVTRDLLNDQQALKLGDIIRNTGGVTVTGDGLFADRIYLRGLEVGSRDFRKDGFLDPTFVPRDFQNVERVEILKGPASVLYGAGSPSGMVNIITKKPQDGRFSAVGFQFGSYGQQRYLIDTNGQATQSGNVNYRLNVANEDINSFRDTVFTSRTQIAPGVTWKMNDSTRLTWIGEYHKDTRRGDQGIPAIGNDPLALPRRTYIGEPANDKIRFQEFRQSLMLTHDINENWVFNIGGNSLFYKFPGSVTSASGNPAPGFFPDVPPPLFYRSRQDIVQEDEQSQSMITNLAGDFYTGQFRHKAVVGMEYVYFDSKSLYNFGAVQPINAANPVYLNPPAIPFGSAAFNSYRQQRVGGYLQDLVEINPYLKAMGGVRFDSADFTFNRVVFGNPVNFNDTFYRVSPRAGIVFQPFGDDALAGYFNYSQSFSPPGGGIYFNGNGGGAIRPILGETYEAGIKTEIISGLSLNVAGFHTVRKNADLNTSSFFLTQVGQERSQGAELNLLGQISERVSTTANYTYCDCMLFDSLDPTFNNKRQRNVPYNSANLWTRFNFIQDPGETAGVALGYVYLDKRPGNLSNTLFLPSYGRWDAGLYYNRGQLGASVYLENLFNIKYAASSVNEFQVYPGAPMNGRATITYSF